MRAARAVLIGHHGLRNFRRRFGGFAVLSGIGWIVDFLTYNSMTLLHVGLIPVGLFWANIVGAAAGMGTVFVGARLSVFRDSRAPLRRATSLYAGWSIFAVLFASLLIDWVGRVLEAPSVQPVLMGILALAHSRMPVNLAISIIAKLVITPVNDAFKLLRDDGDQWTSHPHTARARQPAKPGFWCLCRCTIAPARWPASSASVNWR